jgi:hypothetical protein
LYFDRAGLKLKKIKINFKTIIQQTKGVAHETHASKIILLHHRFDRGHRSRNGLFHRGRKIMACRLEYTAHSKSPGGFGTGDPQRAIGAK